MSDLDEGEPRDDADRQVAAALEVLEEAVPDDREFYVAFSLVASSDSEGNITARSAGAVPDDVDAGEGTRRMLEAIMNAAEQYAEALGLSVSYVEVPTIGQG